MFCSGSNVIQLNVLRFELRRASFGHAGQRKVLFSPLCLLCKEPPECGRSSRLWKFHAARSSLILGYDWQANREDRAAVVMDAERTLVLHDQGMADR